MIIVAGHLNPDTDNVAAALAMANLLKTQEKEASAYKKGNLNKETVLALKLTGLENQLNDLAELAAAEEQAYFFVDFNEESQAPVAPEKIKLLGLADHHKLGGKWQTDEPILFRVEPLGATSTLLCKMYQEKNISLPPDLAKLLLCGIISDTLKLTSPTTTDEDKIWAGILAKQTGIDIDELAFQLFEAKSDLSEFTPEEVAKLDYKEFDYSGKKVGIGVIETVDPSSAKKIEKELKAVMQKIKESDGLDFILLGVVDILNNETEMLLISEEAKDLIMKSFSDIMIRDENLVLKGVVSRKKQIVPALEKTLAGHSINKY
jgi:manganese-dependent inorganic pyrophosphatase